MLGNHSNICVVSCDDISVMYKQRMRVSFGTQRKMRMQVVTRCNAYLNIFMWELGLLLVLRRERLKTFSDVYKGL